MKKPLISLCVPAYNRSDTLSQLITSFFLQNYSNKELVISDDSTTDDVANLIKSLNKKEIKYFKNSPSLGFPKNLLASMMRAKGEYLVVLGDDDVLYSEKSLESYVKIFTKYPDVHFIYSNQIQFNSSGRVESVITKFPNDTLFKPGSESIDNMFIHSIFIGGQGFRSRDNLQKLYPKKNILHPQVQLVGSLLAQHASFGLSEYSVGVRSHQDQIIFRALKNKKIQMDGEHMNIELPQIYRSLIKKYNIQNNEKRIITQLINNYPTVIIKEKMYLGNETVTKYFKMFTGISRTAKESRKLRVMYDITLFTPVSILIVLRYLAIFINQLYNRNLFREKEKKLRMILNSV
jgi:glycosyltransferase involved in cell wall biosynthesis